MATEKILIFDEAGNAKRMKVRIARFLDNEPVTSSDKENIRETLGVDDSLSGTFTTALSVTSANDSSFSGGGDLSVSGGVTTLTNSGDNALRVESTNGNPMTVNVVGAAQNYIFDVRDDGTSKFRVDGSGKVGIGGAPTYELDVQAANARIAATSSAGVVNHLQADNAAAYVGPLSNHALAIKTNNAERLRVDASGNLGVGQSSPAAVIDATGAGTGGRGLRIVETTSSKSNGVYTLEVDSSAHGSNTSAAGAMKVDVAGGRAVTVDGQGRTGIGTDSPSSLSAAANNLVVGSGTGNQGLTVFSGSANEAAIYFADGTAGNQAYRGYVVYQNASDSLVFGSSGTTRWSIDSSGNLVANSTGIDFGSGASTTLDAYEEGTFTGTFRDATSGGNASSTTFPGVYTRIGDVVYFRVGCGNISTSGMTAGNVIYLHGLPFQASASKSGPVNAVQTDTVTTGDYLTVAANAGTSYCDFRKNTSGAGDAQLLVSDLTSGTSDMTVSGYYYV